MGVGPSAQPSQAGVGTKTALVLALCGSRLDSYVRLFGFCLKPVIYRVSVYSSALLVQLVSAASDLFFELSASLCSLVRYWEWNWPGLHGEVPPTARSRPVIRQHLFLVSMCPRQLYTRSLSTLLDTGPQP